jgi:hypothetical protein
MWNKYVLYSRYCTQNVMSINYVTYLAMQYKRELPGIEHLMENLQYNFLKFSVLHIECSPFILSIFCQSANIYIYI